jgi:SAM-dependent methyltransferase
MGVSERLEQLTWTGEREAVLGDVAFRLPDLDRAGAGESSPDSFALLKDRSIVRAYVDYWRERPGFEADNVFEIGLWDGGSIALWHEILQPRTHVGVDIDDRRTAYFDEYAAAARRGERIRTYWDVDQSDKQRLAQIVAENFEAPLDLILDDGSHLYRQTRAAMEALLPLLRPGGLYVVEDWAWAHWGPEYRLHASPERASLTRLVAELAGIVGSDQEIVGALDVRRPFFVIERGHGEVAGDLDLDRLRRRHGRGWRESPVGWQARRYLNAARRRLGPS